VANKLLYKYNFKAFGSEWFWSNRHFFTQQLCVLLFSGVASSIIAEGGVGGVHIHISVFTDLKNNWFQKKLIMQITNIWIWTPPLNYRAGYTAAIVPTRKQDEVDLHAHTSACFVEDCGRVRYNDQKYNL
jgi:hypothetical protein